LWWQHLSRLSKSSDGFSSLYISPSDYFPSKIAVMEIQHLHGNYIVTSSILECRVMQGAGDSDRGHDASHDASFHVFGLISKYLNIEMPGLVYDPRTTDMSVCTTTCSTCEMYMY
jgi:hypothetical protein